MYHWNVITFGFFFQLFSYGRQNVYERKSPRQICGPHCAATRWLVVLPFRRVRLKKEWDTVTITSWDFTSLRLRHDVLVHCGHSVKRQLQKIQRFCVEFKSGDKLRSTSLRNTESWSTDLNNSEEEASEVPRQTFTITASSEIGTHHRETTLHGTRAEEDCLRDGTVSSETGCGWNTS